MVKKDIASMSHSFSHLHFSKSGADSKKIGRKDLPWPDDITLNDDDDDDIKQAVDENKGKKGKRGKKSVKYLANLLKLQFASMVNPLLLRIAGPQYSSIPLFIHLWRRHYKSKAGLNSP